MGRDFPPVQTAPGDHPASCTMGTGSFPRVKYGRGVLLTTHPFLVPRSWKSRAIPLPLLLHTTGPVSGTRDDQNKFLIITRCIILRTVQFQTKVVEKIKTHILCSLLFFSRKSCRLLDHMEKYCRAGQAANDNMAHAHCMLDI